jgi:2',3'-cyclic-nucleotide 2'-phosphodiesterase/3'-nucleotidase
VLNGVYTIYAEDEAGNKSVYRLVVKNFDDNLLSSPTVDSYTNRKTKITGRGEPLTNVIITAPTGTYVSKVGKDGTFSYGLPAQKSGSKLTVYLKDETKKLESARVIVEVKRTGPNFPIVKDINNIQDTISGDMNDEDAVLIAIVDGTVYVPENGGKELYMVNTEIYDPGLDIVKVKFDKDKQNAFAMTVGPLEAGAAVKLYSLDHIGRNIRGDSKIVQQLGPDAPVVYEISNIERCLNGIIPNTKKSIPVAIRIGSDTHTVQTEKDGSFSFRFDSQLQEGEIISVQAIGSMNGATRRSYTTQIKVHDINDYMNTASRSLVFEQITDKSNLISGMNSDEGTVYLAIVSGKDSRMENTLESVETEVDGSFQYILEEKLPVGTTVYAMTRFTDGKILHAVKYTVIEGRPDKPVFVKRITNTDKQLQVASKKDCNVVVKIGSKTYASKQYEHDKEKNQYIYTVNINRTISDSEVKITSTNQAGTSDELVLYVVKVAPDQPTVDVVKAGDTTITGKVELYDYTPEEGTTEKKAETKTPKHFKKAPKKVAKTQTRVFAQIGDQVYEGSINNEGVFKMEIPALEAGTDIFIWGSNKGGRGPLVKVTVIE